MSKVILIVGKSKNMEKIQKRLLEDHSVTVTYYIEEPPYGIPKDCGGVIILVNEHSTRDSVKEIFDEASAMGVPFAIVRDKKWSAMLPALLAKGVLKRDLFNENLGSDPFDIRECASSCVVEYYLSNKIMPGHCVKHFLEKVFPDYRLTEEDLLRINHLSAWAHPPMSLDDPDPLDAVTSGELLVKKSPEPFNNSLNQLPEIHWAEPPEPPRKPLTVEDVVEIFQALKDN